MDCRHVVRACDDFQVRVDSFFSPSRVLKNTMSVYVRCATKFLNTV